VASFTDSKGRTWSITLTIGLAAQLKNKYGLDFVGALYDPEKAWAIIGELYKDLVRFCEMIHTAAGVDISLDDFMAGLTGDDINNAFEALDQAFTDFYPLPKREKVAQTKDRIKAALETGQEDILEEINQKVETEIVGALRKAAGPILNPGK